MALIDIFADSSNISTLIEFTGLLVTVYLFYRKINEDNNKRIISIKESLGEVKKDLHEGIQDAEKRLCTRITEVKLEVDKLENNFYSHLGDFRYGRTPMSNMAKESLRNGDKAHKNGDI